MFRDLLYQNAIKSMDKLAFEANKILFKLVFMFRPCPIVCDGI